MGSCPFPSRGLPAVPPAERSHTLPLQSHPSHASLMICALVILRSPMAPSSLWWSLILGICRWMIFDDYSPSWHGWITELTTSPNWDVRTWQPSTAQNPSAQAYKSCLFFWHHWLLMIQTHSLISWCKHPWDTITHWVLMSRSPSWDLWESYLGLEETVLHTEFNYTHTHIPPHTHMHNPIQHTHPKLWMLVWEYSGLASTDDDEDKLINKI